MSKSTGVKVHVSKDIELCLFCLFVLRTMHCNMTFGFCFSLVHSRKTTPACSSVNVNSFLELLDATDVIIVNGLQGNRKRLILRLLPQI